MEMPTGTYLHQLVELASQINANSDAMLNQVSVTLHYVQQLTIINFAMLILMLSVTVIGIIFICHSCYSAKQSQDRCYQERFCHED